MSIQELGIQHTTGIGAAVLNARRGVCSVCGKGFAYTPEHVYKMVNANGKTQYMCSYTCLRAAQKERQARKEAEALAREQHDEASEQRALFEWARLQAGKYPELQYLYHVPNGGRRDAKEAAMLKAEGVRAGVPDLFLPAARGGYHGLYIELKRKKGGKLSREQEQWLAYLNSAGYRALCIHGWENAANEILKYVKQRGKP